MAGKQLLVEDTASAFASIIAVADASADGSNGLVIRLVLSFIYYLDIKLYISPYRPLYWYPRENLEPRSFLFN